MKLFFAVSEEMLLITINVNKRRQFYNDSSHLRRVPLGRFLARCSPLGLVLGLKLCERVPHAAIKPAVPSRARQHPFLVV